MQPNSCMSRKAQHSTEPLVSLLRKPKRRVSIERKTVSDLVGSCMGENRERFERELHRLRGYRFKRLLVVGSEAEILAGQSITRTSNQTPCWPVSARSRRGTISRSCSYRPPGLARDWWTACARGGKTEQRWLNPYPKPHRRSGSLPRQRLWKGYGLKS